MSPTSVERDLITKRREYAQAGLEYYWIVEPEMPAVAIYERNDGELVRVAYAEGNAALTVEAPVQLTFTPADLVR